MKVLALLSVVASALPVAFAQNGTLVDSISGSTSFKFTTLLKLAGGLPDIVSALTGKGPLTLFAPTDEAFAKLQSTDAKTFDAVAKDPKLLAAVLSYHVLPGVAFDPAQAKPVNFAKTALADQVLRADVGSGKVTLFYGLGNSSVIGTLPAGNGVVHAIDTVLIPPASASETAVAAKFTSLVDALKKVEFVSVADSLKNITIFAPTNEAFAELAAFAKENKLEITDAILSATLSLHVVKGVIYSTDIKPGSVNVGTAYQGTTVTVKADDKGVTVSGPGNKTPAKVILTDVLINGGVIHVIDKVLLPDLATVKPGSGKNGINLPSFDKPQTGILNSANDRSFTSGVVGLFAVAVAGATLF